MINQGLVDFCAEVYQREMHTKWLDGSDRIHRYPWPSLKKSDVYLGTISAPDDTVISKEKEEIYVMLPDKRHRMYLSVYDAVEQAKRNDYELTWLPACETNQDIKS